MRPVTISLNGIKDPQVAAALQEIERASQDTLQNDTSSSGSAMATLTGAAADEVAYFTSQYTTAFASLTAYGRSLIGAVSAAASLTLLGVSAFVQGLIGAANAATFLTGLGFSTFGSTLIGLAGPAIPVAQGGTGDTGTAWTAYAPAITAATGAFTTVSATGRYKQIGKTVFVQISIVDTANGTAATNAVSTLPVPASVAALYSLSGINSAGAAITCLIVATNQLNIFKYDTTFPLGTGQQLWITGVYEAA